MKLENKLTGDVLEYPPPDRYGHTAVFINGVPVLRVSLSDKFPMIVTEDGREFTVDSFTDHIIELLKQAGSVKP